MKCQPEPTSAAERHHQVSWPRSANPLLPLRLLASRDRSGAYLIMLCAGTALFGMFFFLTLFMQAVWGYSALRTGVAYLPMMAAILAMSGASVQLVPRIGVVALSRVQPAVAGVASSLLNTGQQVGGSIGLAVLGTVAWSAVVNSSRSQAAAAAARAGHAMRPGSSGHLAAVIYQRALAVGFSRGFEVSAVILLFALIVTITAIRVRRSDLDGTQRP